MDCSYLSKNKVDGEKWAHLQKYNQVIVHQHYIYN